MHPPELTALDANVTRLEYGALYTDFVKTSRGLLRVGSMPDISKLTYRLNLLEDAVVLPEWSVNQAGDNYTGEEFVLWRAQVYGSRPKKYIGSFQNVEIMHHNLDAIFSYYFDEKRIRIVRKPWLKQWVLKKGTCGVYRDHDLEIRFTSGNLAVYDHGRALYDGLAFSPATKTDTIINEVLSRIQRDGRHRDHLEITAVGNGNGFVGTTSSFLLRFGRKALWIDPCAQPAHALACIGVHWDDVTDILISHNHEDHIAGFSACLKRCIDHRKKLRLISAPSIYRVLCEQYSRLFPDMKNHVDFNAIVPGKPISLDGVMIEARWNHHFLPYGTLGLKFEAGGRKWGFSGDTKFDTGINRFLKRPELYESWFCDCDLVFHEVDFEHPHGVHSYWKEVAKIQDAIQGKMLVYHTAAKNNPPLPLVRKGHVYRIS